GDRTRGRSRRPTAENDTVPEASKVGAETPVVEQPIVEVVADMGEDGRTSRRSRGGRKSKTDTPRAEPAAAPEAPASGRSPFGAEGTPAFLLRPVRLSA